ncbi:MAG: hypothetical protein DMG43_12615 [Acidobacteria bacterium]|nr:MAG: hypothetical protein DMG43_12615 [Acidobacteriota bacterium]
MNTLPAGKLAVALLLTGRCLLWSQSPPAERGQTPAAGYVLKQAISGKQVTGNLRGWRFSLWQASALDSSFASLPAKLCAIRAQSKSQAQEACYEARAGNDVFFQDAQARPVVLQVSPSPREAILFQASSSSGGSGWGRLLVLLVPDEPNKKLRNLLPEVVLSSQGEFKFWEQPSFSDYKLLTIADVIAGANDTHFAAHRYKIRTYAYCQKQDFYVLADEYATSKKYPGLDETDEIRVLGPEQPALGNILQGPPLAEHVLFRKGPP